MDRFRVTEQEVERDLAMVEVMVTVGEVALALALGQAQVVVSITVFLSECRYQWWEVHCHHFGIHFPSKCRSRSRRSTSSDGHTEGSEGDAAMEGALSSIGRYEHKTDGSNGLFDSASVPVAAQGVEIDDEDLRDQTELIHTINY